MTKNTIPLDEVRIRLRTSPKVDGGVKPMRQHELQNIQPWINSRHNVQQDEEISDAVWDEILSLQSDADNAMMACLFLGGMLLMLVMVAYIAIVNHLI